VLLHRQPLQLGLQRVGADECAATDVQDFRAITGFDALVEEAAGDAHTGGGFILRQNLKIHAAPVRTACNEG